VRYSDGKRRISNISEITGLESGIITMQELYKYEQTGVTADGGIQGEFSPTGITPTFADQFKKAGISLEMGLAGMRWR
jgi:pilus assembly protein CpaF